MPHLIDRETGLCQICKKGEIAAIKEGRKFKRQTYDIRKAAVESMTHKEDPNYHLITDRHYISDMPRKSIVAPIQGTGRSYQPAVLVEPPVTRSGFKTYSKSPFSSPSDQFDSEDEEVRRIEANARNRKLSVVSRENYKYANIAHASRLGVLPDMLQVSEPNLVYATTAAAVSNQPYIAVAEESPRYIVVNNDNNVYYEPPPTTTNIIKQRKKKVIVHHYEDTDGNYTTVVDNSGTSPIIIQEPQNVIYYQS